MTQNFVHPTAIIHKNAKIGSRNYFGPHCVIEDGVSIGDDNKFFGFVSVGMTAEHKDFFSKLGKVRIGNGNIVREYVTINSSTTGTTTMGNECIMLRGSHLSHDSILEDNVTVSCNVLIGGESYIMKGSNLGLGCILHQRQVVGSYSMIGMGAILPKTIEISPGGIYVGNPAKFIKRNSIGLERSGVTERQLDEEIRRFKELRHKSN